MAEQLILICDVDGATPAVQTVKIQVSNRSYAKDLCRQHLDALLEGARTPKRGRRRGVRIAKT
jgi:hypothetical protein